jgi:hypothetical protein
MPGHSALVRDRSPKAAEFVKMLDYLNIPLEQKWLLPNLLYKPH